MDGSLLCYGVRLDFSRLESQGVVCFWPLGFRVLGLALLLTGSCKQQGIRVSGFGSWASLCCLQVPGSGYGYGVQCNEITEKMYAQTKRVLGCAGANPILRMPMELPRRIWPPDHSRYLQQGIDAWAVWGRLYAPRQVCMQNLTHGVSIVRILRIST